MQIVCHVGAHNTDNDRLLKCLLKNRDNFVAAGVSVPPPGRYRKLLHQTLLAMHENTPSPDARDILLESILEEENTERVIFSNESFFCVPNMALRGGTFYDQGHERAKFLAEIFENDEVEIFIGICNPATFLPIQLERSKFDNLADLTFGADPRDLRWSELIGRLRAHCPGAEISVWCNEDTPLIWSEVVREMAGLPHASPIKGEYDLLSEIMTDEGMQRFSEYLESHSNMTLLQTRRVIAAFLSKFARDEMIEEEVNIPGWTDTLIEELSDIYDEDVELISRMPGVHFITP